MEVPEKCKELGIEKIVFGPAALKTDNGPVNVKLSYNVLQERTAYVLNAIAAHDDLLAALEMILAEYQNMVHENRQDGFLLETVDNAIAKARGGA